MHRFGGLNLYPTLANSKMENNYPYKPDWLRQIIGGDTEYHTD